jgi:phage repressor protein C with HTH and peptisase S24 domain
MVAPVTGLGETVTMRETFDRWLLRQLNERGWKHRELAARAHVGRSTVTTWLNGQAVPEGKNLLNLADALGIDSTVVLDAANVRADTFGNLSSQSRTPSRQEVVWVPVRMRAAADVDHGELSMVPWVPKRLMSPTELARIFAVVITGDCMAPRYLDGDSVIVDPQGPRKAGRGIVMLVDGEYHVKELAYEEGAWVLRDNLGKQLVPHDEGTILGVVIGLYRDED